MEGFILVDFPNYCVDCKFCREINEGTEACCEMTVDPDEYDCYRMIDDYCQSKPDWCPIKSMPERKQVDRFPEDKGVFPNAPIIDIGMQMGWNVCIDTITEK